MDGTPAYREAMRQAAERRAEACTRDGIDPRESHEYKRTPWSGECGYCGSNDPHDGKHPRTMKQITERLNSFAKAAIKDSGLERDRKHTPTIEVGGCVVTAKLSEEGTLEVDIKVRGANTTLMLKLGERNTYTTMVIPRVHVTTDADSMSFAG